jgi:hypothetical protein
MDHISEDVKILDGQFKLSLDTILYRPSWKI